MFSCRQRIAVILGVLLCVFGTFALADEYKGTASFSPEELRFSRSAGFDFVDFKGADYLNTVGAPCIPFQEIKVALPPGAAVLGVEVRGVDLVALSGTYFLMPNGEPICIGDEPPAVPFPMDSAIYGANLNYPGLYAESLDTWDLAGQTFVTLHLYPVQYNPATLTVSLATRIDFSVSYQPSRGAQPGAFNFSPKVRAYYQRMLERMAFNPESISPMVEYMPSMRATLDPGTYEYVIITSASFVSSFQPLADWRTQMGMPARIVDTNWLYANYSGSNNQERIRNFIIDAHTSWGSLYFLLGGDTNVIPKQNTTVNGSTVPNDKYYADYDDDWKQELCVGRAPVNSSGDVSNFVNKVLTYEKSPPTSYGSKVLLLGFDLDSSTDGEDACVRIENEILIPETTLSTEYDSEGGTHVTDTRDYINQGQNLVNHIDHCNTSYLGVGSVNHGGGFSNTDAQNFTNGTRYINVCSVGCYINDYPSTCWGETLVRDDQGGVSFTGNSRNGIYQAGNTNGFSFSYNRRWWESIYDRGAYRAGEALQDSLNMVKPFDATLKYIWTELTLIGDPALHFWTREPANLTITHDAGIGRGAQMLTVHAAGAGSPLEGALVCVMKGSEVYAYGTSDASGDVDLFINPQTAGSMTVTVTAHNYRHYQGTLTVTSAFAPPWINAVLPRNSPVTGGTQITLTGFNFAASGSMTVRVGGNVCSGVAIVDDTTVTCTVPAGNAGWQGIEMSNTYGSNTLNQSFLYFPVGGNSYNAADMDTASLDTPAEPVFVVSGASSNPYMVFFALGGGPLPTPFGNAGLDNTITFLLSSNLNMQGYALIPLVVPAGFGPLDLYFHVLGLNGGQAVWSYGGNNPNGTGSIWLQLND
ncbi:MAG: C25 family cysteine peptidase [Planctomycetota bacterium]